MTGSDESGVANGRAAAEAGNSQRALKLGSAAAATAGTAGLSIPLVTNLLTPTSYYLINATFAAGVLGALVALRSFIARERSLHGPLRLGFALCFAGGTLSTLAYCWHALDHGNAPANLLGGVSTAFLGPGLLTVGWVLVRDRPLGIWRALPLLLAALFVLRSLIKVLGPFPGSVYGFATVHLGYAFLWLVLAYAMERQFPQDERGAATTSSSLPPREA